MLTGQQHREFHERGFVRLEAAFSPTDAAAMQQRVWEELGHRHGIVPGDPTTWRITQAVGLQHLRDDPAFQAIGGAATTAALDEILGAGRWRRPRHWGQFLVSFPAAEASWTVPDAIWHTDFGFLTPPDEVSGLLMLSFLSDVPPRSGATAAVAGSPRLVRRFVARQPPEVLQRMKTARRAFLRSDPWLQALTTKDDGADRIDRFMATERLVAGVPVQVVELTGKAGDVILGHPWLLHAPAANCGERPRMMRVQRVRLAGDRPGDSAPRSRRPR